MRNLFFKCTLPVIIRTGLPESNRNFIYLDKYQVCQRVDAAGRCKGSARESLSELSFSLTDFGAGNILVFKYIFTLT